MRVLAALKPHMVMENNPTETVMVDEVEVAFFHNAADLDSINIDVMEYQVFC